MFNPVLVFQEQPFTPGFFVSLPVQLCNGFCLYLQLWSLATKVEAKCSAASPATPDHKEPHLLPLRLCSCPVHTNRKHICPCALVPEFRSPPRSPSTSGRWRCVPTCLEYKAGLALGKVGWPPKLSEAQFFSPIQCKLSNLSCKVVRFKQNNVVKIP